MIFCLSQIHTGTNSVLAWLKAHEDCDGVLLSNEVYGSKQEPATVYHEHVRKDSRFNKQMCRTQIVMAWAHPTVIPLRDPLACVLSYHHRAIVTGQIGTDLFQPLQDVVDRWCLLAECEDRFEGAPGIFWMPWDIEHLVTKHFLWHTARGLGLNDPVPSRGGLPCENSSGDYPLRKAYEDGDLECLRSIRAVNYLRDCEPVLRPFLERRGYANLLWWS